jgi:hypothetical protein
VRRIWRVAWASPGTLLGLILAPFFRRRSFVRQVIVCEGASWVGRLGWRYRAMTLGHVVLCVDDIDADVLGHELVHVCQWERWGPAFVLAYPLAALAAFARGKHQYRDNHFEVEARRISGR